MAVDYQTAAVEVARVAPAAALGGQPIFGYTLPEWAAIAGIAYTVIQLGFLIYDRFQKYKKEKANGCKL